jgi:hypothetical protein
MKGLSDNMNNKDKLKDCRGCEWFASLKCQDSYSGCYLDDLQKKKIKVIFLDIDGVINTGAYNKETKEIWMGCPWDETIDNPHAINLVQALIDRSDAKVVVSSSWRYGRDSEYFSNLFKKNGLICDIIDITPRLNGLARGHEIQAWLDANKNLEIEEFVIIDDDADMVHLKDYLVKCDSHSGFNILNLDEAEVMLGVR